MRCLTLDDILSRQMISILEAFIIIYAITAAIYDYQSHCDSNGEINRVLFVLRRRFQVAQYSLKISLSSSVYYIKHEQRTPIAFHPL